MSVLEMCTYCTDEEEKTTFFKCRAKMDQYGNYWLNPALKMLRTIKTQRHQSQ
jgi:hypothetical protein